MKKLTAILISLALLLSLGIACPAAEERVEHITNGSFEQNNGTAPTDWKIDKAVWGEKATLDTRRPADGKFSVRLVNDGGNPYIWRSLTMQPNLEYTLSFQVRADVPGDAGIKIEFKGADGHLHSLDEKFVPTVRWETKTYTFTTTAEVTGANILFRTYGAGDYSYDAVSLSSLPIPEPEPIPDPNYLEPLSGSENLIANASFEEADAQGNPVNWSPFKTEWAGNAYASIDNSVAHTGEKSLKISTDSGGNPWVRQTVDIVPNTRYQLSIWTRSTVAGTGAKQVRFKLEYYTGTPSAATGNKVDDSITTSNIAPMKANAWEQQTIWFTPPEGTVKMQVYCRLYVNGTYWFDDLELKPLENRKVLELRPDQYFYYPDVETGYARARIFSDYRGQYSDGTVDFELRDKDNVTVLKEQTGSALTDDIATFSYPISLLKEKKTEYFLSATLRDKDGNAVDTTEKKINVYDRPTLMNEDGYILNEDGTVFHGTLGYHTNRGNDLVISEGKAMGMNLFGLSSGGATMFYGNVKNLTDPEQIKAKMETSLLKKWLDDLHANGMKGLVCLYEKMEAAAHPMNREMTRVVVEYFKDHPAIAAWSVMDEPYDMLDEPEYWLYESYKLIRDIDDKHPIYFVDNSPRIDESSALADIVACDPYLSYPATSTPIYENYPTCGNNPAAYPGETAQIQRRTVERYGKGFMSLNQAFRYHDYIPTSAELRSFWYQCMFERVHGAGWYEIVGTDALLSLQQEGYPLVDWLTKFASEEQGFATELFARNSICPLFNIYDSHQYAYKSVVRGSDLYMLIINRKAEVQEITVSLKSQNGLLTASGVPEEMYLAGDSVKPVVNGDTLTVTIPSANVSLIKLAGAVPDTAPLAEASFDDLAEYEWAAEAIEALYKKDIVSRKGERAFAPGETITRGDFAKYLIRALDLERMSDRGQLEESFADVPEDADYYREVRVGKSFGILRGTGDNNFNPEAPITRQDLMVICARGLRAAFKAGGEMADLLAFPDGASVADYAKNDVALMNAMGTVKGNADGTLNPLGNTTRAEAAVIMQRICEI